METSNIIKFIKILQCNFKDTNLILRKNFEEIEKELNNNDIVLINILDKNQIFEIVYCKNRQKFFVYVDFFCKKIDDEFINDITLIHNKIKHVNEFYNYFK